MEFLRRQKGLIARFAVSAAILICLGRKIDWTPMSEIIRRLDGQWTFVAILVWGLSALVAAFRWRILLEVQGVRISFRQAVELFFVGHFFNAFLLGTTGGDVAKIYYATKLTGTNKEGAGLSVIMDRIIGLIAILLMAVLLIILEYSFLTQTPKTRAMVWLVFLIILGGFAVGIIAWMLPSIRLPVRIQEQLNRLPFAGIRKNLKGAFGRFVAAWRSNLVALLLSFCIHGCTLVMAVSLMRALNVTVEILPFVSTLPIIGVLMSIPVTLSGFGLREGLFVLFLGLSPLNVAAVQALAFSLLFFSVSLIWSLMGGLVYLRYRGPRDSI